MKLPSLDELRPLLDLCASKGVAHVKAGDVEVTFFPGAHGRTAAQNALSASREEMAEDDEDQQRYEREMAAWRRTQGDDDDPAVDG